MKSTVMDCGPSELESEQYWVREEYESIQS